VVRLGRYHRQLRGNQVLEILGQLCLLRSVHSRPRSLPQNSVGASTVANFSGRHKSNLLRLSGAAVVKPQVGIDRGALGHGKPIFSIHWRAGRQATFSTDDPHSCRHSDCPTKYPMLPQDADRRESTDDDGALESWRRPRSDPWDPDRPNCRRARPARDRNQDGGAVGVRPGWVMNLPVDMNFALKRDWA
jgi:hypothetical protein